MKKEDVVEEIVSVEHKDSKAKTNDLDEQLKLLGKDMDINQNSHTLIEAAVSVEAESAPHQNLDDMFGQMSDGNHGVVNGNGKVEKQGSKQGSTKLPVGRVLSFEEEKELIESGALRRAERDVHPRHQPTQEDLLPLYLEAVS